MEPVFTLIAELGFPIAVACACGYFIYLILKFILGGVLGSIKGLQSLIMALDKRVKSMNADVIRIDTLISSALGLNPDTERIGRADGQDGRRD